MNISEAFIKRPIMTVLVMTTITIAGIVAYTTLPVSDLPVVDSPVITISVGYPGASPDTMASAVATPIENQCTQIPGLQKMISNNTLGQTQIILTFDLDRNVDLAAPDVQAAISRAMGDLPTDLPAPPSYTKTNPSDTPVIYLLLTSDTLTRGQLYDLGNKRVGQRMSMIEGVSQVQVWGAKAAVRVQVDPNKLSQFQIGIDEIGKSLFDGTVLIPAGSLNGKYRTFSLEPNGQMFNAEQYKELIVAYRNNAPIRLKDVANVIDSVDNDVINVMTGDVGEEVRGGAVVIPITRSAGSNTVALAKRVANTVMELKKELPGSVRLSIFHDKSEQIVESIDDVKTTIYIAIALVVIVIFFFIGRVSDTIIPAVAIPVSIIATFACMLLLGFSLDNLSLLGIILAVGFVVDDAIVVLENNDRLIALGQNPEEASINGAKEIGFTIISMTLSLVIIFIPLLFMAGVVGRSFREFSITVVMTIIISGIISLTLTPMMCARMLKGGEKKKSKFEEVITKYINKITNGYGAILKWILLRPFTTIITWIICFAGTIWLFMALPQSFLPEGDSGAVNGAMLSSLGTSTEQMLKFQNQVNEIILNDPNVERMVSVTGLQPGADQTSGPFFIKLKPPDKRKPMPEVVKELRAKFAKIDLGYVFVMAVPALQISTGGTSTAAGSKYSYVISGPDLDIVNKTAMELEKKMREIPGIIDVQNSVKLNLPEINIDIDRDRASTLGVSAQDIEYGLCLSYAQGKITTFKTDIDQYYVITELDKKYQKDPDNLYQLYLNSSNNKLVPLGSVAQWREGVGPQNVPHLQQLNCGTISFNVKTGVPLGTATGAIEKVAQATLPAGITGKFEGEADEFNDAIASLGLLIIIAVCLKYVLLGILYENYVHPITILTTLPVATFGGLATLFIFGSELSLYAYIGLFMLLGIVAKNGIMMVDFANENIEKGMSNFDAMLQASIVRFRPITMTGLAAIAGAMPIALGYGADGASRKPLGLIVVGGMIFSQVITLFVTPGIFLYMQKFQEKYLNRFELTRAGSARKQKENTK
jgi:HAE1 family hydrophobic/amphiphilic exporter-1